MTERQQEEAWKDRDRLEKLAAANGQELGFFNGCPVFFNKRLDGWDGRTGRSPYWSNHT